jgi:transposase-like protein
MIKMVQPKILSAFLAKIKAFFLPNRRQSPKISATREVSTLPRREVKDVISDFSVPEINQCPYCASKDVIKRGKRKKKLEVRQRYYCNSCKRSFVPQTVKGKQYPLKMILDGLCHYNTGYSLEESARLLKDENKFIEDALKECNKAVVYLEQARDIYLKDTEGTALCEDLIKRYILLRRKTFNLSRAWRQLQ